MNAASQRTITCRNVQYVRQGSLTFPTFSKPLQMPINGVVRCRAARPHARFSRQHPIREGDLPSKFPDRFFVRALQVVKFDQVLVLALPNYFWGAGLPIARKISLA